MSKRFNRSSLVSSAMEGSNGWDRDPYAAGAVPAWFDRFPDLPIVADGRKVTGFTRKGRGTTGFDLFRVVDSGGLLRTDFLSIKTGKIEKTGKLPSKLELSTGNIETLDALIAGIAGGASLPTVVFVSRSLNGGIIDTDGLALFLELGAVLRKGIAGVDEGPYGKGKAPPAYFKWSSRRKCGGKYKTRVGEFPQIDEQGRKWSAPNFVHYRELVVSLSALGISRSSWIPCSMGDLADFVECQDWDTMSLGI